MVLFICFQVKIVNEAIDMAEQGSPMYGLAHIEDPSESIQLVHIKWMEYYMLSRRQDLSESDIVDLHKMALAGTCLTHLKKYYQRERRHQEKGLAGDSGRRTACNTLPWSD